MIYLEFARLLVDVPMAFEFSKLPVDVAIAFATAKFLAMLNGGKVDGNRRGSGVNGSHDLELSSREVAKFVSTRSGSFIHCKSFRGLTNAKFFRFEGFAVALLLTLIFKGPLVASYNHQIKEMDTVSYAPQ